MTDNPVHHGRRRFLKNVFHDPAGEPVARLSEEALEARQRELYEDAYEIGLRAWGPDFLPGSAESLGVAVEKADYKTIAKALTLEELEKENKPGGDGGPDGSEEGEGKDEPV